MKPETTADLIAALNNSAAVHDYGDKDDSKTPPPADSIPCTLAGELDSTDEKASQSNGTEEEADTMDHDPEFSDDSDDSEEENQKDNEPSKSEAEKEQEKNEQEAKDAARWHDYARAFASGQFGADNAATHADELLARFKSRFPNA